MEVKNLTETIKPILEKLGLPPFNFTYWAEDNEIVSDGSYEQEGEPDIFYKIIVKVNGTVGDIFSAAIIANEACNEKYLGTVQYVNNGWILTNVA